MSGFFYLHANGHLIFKPGANWDDMASPFVMSAWPVADPMPKDQLWQVAVESLSLGVPLARFSKYPLTDDEALIYAGRVGCRLFKDGEQWCATRGDFVDLQQNPAGFGETGVQAMAALCHELGFRGSRMWSNGFPELLSQAVVS